MQKLVCSSFILLMLSVFVPACAPGASGGEPEGLAAEAVQALGEPCSTACDCPLGLNCYGAYGCQQPYDFGPIPPDYCFADCQCAPGEICGETPISFASGFCEPAPGGGGGSGGPGEGGPGQSEN